MITYSDVERLLGYRSAAAPVLSIYLRVPADPAGIRELGARVGELIALAARADGDGDGDGDGRRARQLSGDEEDYARKLLEVHGREWLGHTAAIFVSAELGLSEAFGLPCEVPDRAVLAGRPHIRPLLVALQRCPVYYAVVADRRHAWLFRVAGGEIETTGTSDQPEQVRSPGFGGWYGLESYRVGERAAGLAHQHYHVTVALLERALRPGGQEPLVIGGHEETIAQFSAALPVGLRDRVVGSFRVDPHTMTPAIVRDLAAPIVAGWVRDQEERVAVQIRQDAWRADPLTVTGPRPVIAAIGQHAVQTLLVPVGGTIPGFVCQRCGVLSSTGTDCPDGPDEARWVPDLIEEMVVRAMNDGGRVEAVADPPGDVAAHLRYPVPEENGR